MGDDKNLAGFGSRSFDMQDTGRESEEPADLVGELGFISSRYESSDAGEFSV